MLAQSHVFIANIWDKDRCYVVLKKNLIFIGENQ